MVLPRLFNATSRTAFRAVKRDLLFNSRTLATAAPVHGKVRYVNTKTNQLINQERF